MTKVVIWQAAGTVFNTDELMIETLEKTMADFEIDEIEFDFNSELETLKRTGLVDLLHRVAAEFSLDYQKFVNVFQQKWDQSVDQISMVNGAMATLKMINDAQIDNWLVSDWSSEMINDVLNHNHVQNAIKHVVLSSQFLTRTTFRELIQSQLKAAHLPSANVMMICSDAIGMQVALDLNINGILLDYDGMVDWQLPGQVIHSLSELKLD